MSSFKKVKIDKEGDNIDQTINPNLESMTIILEMYKLFGKDMNLVITYELFKKIHQNGHGRKKSYSSKDIRNMFLVAL